MRSSNPVMPGRIFEKVGIADSGSSVMTINGTITKIGLMLLLVIASAAYTWNMVLGADPGRAGTFAITGVSRSKNIPQMRPVNASNRFRL